jgi:phage/plasmid-like protein (TIGR03299 family)
MSKATDITIIGNGGSAHATESENGFVPMHRVTDLFDFDVHFTKVYVPGPAGVTEIPNRRAVMNRDTGSVYNVVSGRYAIHQFRDVLIDNVTNLLDTAQGDLGVVGCGLLDDGAVGWVQVAPAEGVVVEGDKVTPTLTVVSSHSGKFATSYRTGMFRMACSNQLGALRSSTASVYRLKHTRRSILRIADAREALGLMFADAAGFTSEMAELIGTSVTDRQFAEIVGRLDPKPEFRVADGEITNEAAITRWENRQEDLWKMWKHDERVGFTGTAWGAYQTFSTYRQQDASYRNMKGVSRPGRNVASLLTGSVDKADRRVLETVTAVAGA